MKTLVALVCCGGSLLSCQSPELLKPSPAPPTLPSASPVEEAQAVPRQTPEPQVSTAPEAEPSAASSAVFSSDFQFRLKWELPEETEAGSLTEISLFVQDGEGAGLEHFNPRREELNLGFIFGSAELSPGQKYRLEVQVQRKQGRCRNLETYLFETQVLPSAEQLPVTLAVPDEAQSSERDCEAQEPVRDELGLSSDDRIAIFYIIDANATAINFKKEHAFVDTYHSEAPIAEQLQDIYWYLVLAQIKLEVVSKNILSYDAEQGHAEVEIERILKSPVLDEELSQKSLYHLRREGKFWKIFEIIDLTPAEDYAQDEAAEDDAVPEEA